MTIQIYQIRILGLIQWVAVANGTLELARSWSKEGVKNQLLNIIRKRKI